jgi:hypothetical protein
MGGNNSTSHFGRCLLIFPVGELIENAVEPGQRLYTESMIRKLSSGEFRLYSRKKDPKTGRRRNLGTFKTREAAQKHERAVQFFKRH